MIPYASRTGTRRNLDALRARGWRLLVSARGEHRTEGFGYAIDNGAWTAHQRGEPFDAGAFARVLDALAAGADWIIVPDVVGESRASLELTAAWLPRVAAYGRPMLIAVQDGMVFADVAPWVAGGAGIFLGGSTEWKLASAVAWGRWCAERDAYYHIGRVNTCRRIRLAQEAGADSIDGTSASRFAVTIPRLDHACRQMHLLESDQSRGSSRGSGHAGNRTGTHDGWNRARSGAFPRAGDRGRTGDIQLGKQTVARGGARDAGISGRFCVERRGER